MNIVSYRKEYAQELRAICLETSYAKGNPREETFILAMYCNGYLESGIVYVLLDDAGKPQGYILCAPDPSAYQEQLKKSMGQMDMFHKFVAKVEARGVAAFAGEYPAHLHIDIREPFTGKGSGTMLMSALLEDLKVRGIPGVMLQVSAKNKRAVAFYKKQGFHVLRSGMISLVMGRKL